MIDINLKRLAALAWLAHRYNEVSETMKEEDKTDLWNELKKIDIDHLQQLVDKAHAQQISDKFSPLWKLGIR